MTAALPSLDLVNTSECVVPKVKKRNESRLNVRSAIESHRSKCEPDDDFSENRNFRKVKRNSDGQVLQVKFADDVVIPDVEKKKALVPSLSSSVNVDHGHYEQWARVPGTGKRITKSTLLRGIQQLKARMKREETNMEIIGQGNRRNYDQHTFVSDEKGYHIKELKRNMLLTSDKFPDNRYLQYRRDRANSGSENVSLKPTIPPRNQLKPNSQLIDSGVFKQDQVNLTAETEVRLSRNSERDSAKLRHGVSRIRDRSAFPISVYQPISVGDHIFLINEPVKDSEIANMKKTDNKSRIETQASNMLFLTDKSKQNTILNKTPELHVHLDMILAGKTSGVTGSFQRSRTTTGGLLPARIQKRTQFVVSSAELYDFSQLSEIRHSMADKFLERSQTELIFPNKAIRHSFQVNNE